MTIHALRGHAVEHVSGARRTAMRPSRRMPAGATAVGQAARRRRFRTRAAAGSAVLVVADLVAFSVAGLLSAPAGPRTLTLLAVILCLFQAGELYRLKLSLSVLDDAPSIVGRSLAAGSAAMVVAGLDDGVAGIARLVTAAIFGVLAVGVRAVAYAGIRAARRRHHLEQRALMLGAGAVSGTLATNLLAHPEYGVRPAGMLDDDPLLRHDQRPVPVLGGYDRLAPAVLEHSIDVVIVTFGAITEPNIVSMLRSSDRLSCEIYFVPRLYELHAVARDTEVLWGIPLMRLRRAPFRTGTWTVKRIADIVVAGLALVLLAPVLAVVAAGARLETGSVLFRQTRIGLDGLPFTLLKFCSLRPAAESESKTMWSIAEDDRLRPFGKLLRRTSLDELPQLWNILRGDMALVGPRPERPFFVDEFTRQFPWYRDRHRVPVGLTGWAQIHGLRGNTSIAERARFDNFYIENWSMWGDIKILMRTFGQVLKAAGR
jgi:exopolysaccharide biosynthesis polyprenyl glycosylphosphotransferase